MLKQEAYTRLTDLVELHDNLKLQTSEYNENLKDIIYTDDRFKEVKLYSINVVTELPEKDLDKLNRLLTEIVQDIAKINEYISDNETHTFTSGDISIVKLEEFIYSYITLETDTDLRLEFYKEYIENSNQELSLKVITQGFNIKDISVPKEYKIKIQGNKPSDRNKILITKNIDLPISNNKGIVEEIEKIESQLERLTVVEE